MDWLADLVGDILGDAVLNSFRLPRSWAGWILLLTALGCLASVVLVAVGRTLPGVIVLGVVAIAWLVVWARARARV